MPFRDDSVDAICDLVDAYRSRRGRRIERAQKSFLHSIDKPYFYQLVQSDEPMERIPHEWREEYLKHRTLDQLRVDAVEAFDKIDILSRKLNRQDFKMWAMGAALTGEGCLILWLANQLMSCLGVVHAASKVVH